MKWKGPLMIALAICAAILWATRFVPGLPLSSSATDFFGGMAMGIGVAIAVGWFAEAQR